MNKKHGAKAYTSYQKLKEDALEEEQGLIAEMRVLKVPGLYLKTANLYDDLRAEASRGCKEPHAAVYRRVTHT